MIAVRKKERPTVGVEVFAPGEELLSECSRTGAIGVDPSDGTPSVVSVNYDVTTSPTPPAGRQDGSKHLRRTA